MAIALDPEQNAVLSEAYKEARRLNASPREAKALGEALLVESNARNLPGGDRDSRGPLQQRPSQGWKHPNDVRLAVRDFLTAARRNRGVQGDAGALAQSVQRSAFPSRYSQKGNEANAILQRYGGGSYGGSSGSGFSSLSSPGVSTRTVNQTVNDPEAQRRVLLAQHLQRTDPHSMLLRLGVVDPNGVTTKTISRTETSGKSASILPASSEHKQGTVSLNNHSPLFELFWQGQGGINVKNGKVVPQGFVTGHADHVHVAAGPKTIVALGQMAQQMGLKVGENPHFGGVHPVHAPHSYHYSGEAIDVSGNPNAMKQFAHQVAGEFGAA